MRVAGHTAPYTPIIRGNVLYHLQQCGCPAAPASLQPTYSLGRAAEMLCSGFKRCLCAISFQKYYFLRVQRGLLGEEWQNLLVKYKAYILKEVRQKTDTYSGTPGLPDATSPGAPPGHMSHQDTWH